MRYLPGVLETPSRAAVPDTVIVNQSPLFAGRLVTPSLPATATHLLTKGDKAILQAFDVLT